MKNRIEQGFIQLIAVQMIDLLPLRINLAGTLFILTRFFNVLWFAWTIAGIWNVLSPKLTDY